MGTKDRKRLRRIRDDVVNRDGSICCYCDMPLAPQDVTMEHILPDSQQGTFNATNLTVACLPCNQRRGSRPFFQYCRQFNFSKEKLAKYKQLYYTNLKIKVLNVAKENCLPQMVDANDQAVPEVLIGKACQILKIKRVSFQEYEQAYTLDIKFQEPSERKRIKYTFQQLIRILEADCR